MSEWGAGLIVGALFALVYVAILINGSLTQIVRELQRVREDNIAWRENVWNRDTDRPR